MSGAVRSGIRSLIVEVVVGAVAMVWLAAWGAVALLVFEPIWREHFYPWTLEGGIPMYAAHGLGWSAFIGGVFWGMALADFLRRRYWVT